MRRRRDWPAAAKCPTAERAHVTVSGVAAVSPGMYVPYGTYLFRMQAESCVLLDGPDDIAADLGGFGPVVIACNYMLVRRRRSLLVEARGRPTGRAWP